MERKPRSLSSFLFSFFRLLSRGLAWLFHYPYIFLSRSGLCRFLVPPSTKIGVVSFKMQGGSQHRLVIGHRVIGKYLYDSEKWDIQAPFRLFVDERKFCIPDIQVEA